MSDELQGRRVAVLVANEGVEQVELTEPWEAIRAAGGEPELIAPEAGDVQAFNHLDKGDTFSVDRTVDQVDAGDYVGLVLPGGVANPDQLRRSPTAVEFVRRMVDGGRPGAVICHGPWTLVEADVVRGRRMTSWPSLRTDLSNAGALWVDDEVVVDRDGTSTFVSSRRPDDLPAFCEALVEQFSQAPVRAGS